MPRDVSREAKGLTAAFAALLFVLGGAPAPGAETSSAARGAYLANAADCVACHTDSARGGQPYAGGRAIATRFGTFYSPNITPDAETGIGRWSDEQFLRALHDGVRPDGANYFPVFPYPSFTKITDADALAIKAYLFSLPPVTQANRAHDVPFPLSWRFLQVGWKLLFFTPGRFQPEPERSAAYNRGAYLVTALAHCGECHTPRNWLGATEPDRYLAGNRDGPDGNKVPNITPDRETGIGDWSEDDIVTLLATGQTPDFDFVGDGMAEVVRNTSRLDDSDRRAIASYLRSLAPIRSERVQ